MNKQKSKEEKKVINATVINEDILTYVYNNAGKQSRIISMKIKSSPKRASILVKSKSFPSPSSVLPHSYRYMEDSVS